MNNGESLVLALHRAESVQRTRRQRANAVNLVLALALAVLATAAVVLAAVPAETAVSVDLTGSEPIPCFGATAGDPANGAWSRAEAEQLACSGNNVPGQICSADMFAATP